MIPFKTRKDPRTGEMVVEMPLKGHELLECPLFNKGSAFSEEERREFGLLGLLPPHVSTMEEQCERTYRNFRLKKADLERYIFLTSLHDRNETLFYRLFREHVGEMMPIIYTPTVGEACRHYSRIYRKPRGLFIAYPLREEMDAILGNVSWPDVRVIVVTDGERILGLGDQGAGGMGIPVGKLALYTLCAGIHPAATLPILLDVGTDNRELINDPLYLGWRHERIRGKDYDDFIEAFVEGVTRRFPNALLQWEDFAKNNAGRLLERYRDRLCSFNDDIQGTGAVALAGILAAVAANSASLKEQRIVILGAGSAAIGISDQIAAAAVAEGVPEKEARGQIWLVDSRGLLLDDRLNPEPQKQKYAQPAEKIAGWTLKNKNLISLEDAVRNIRPTILIGTGAQPGAFTETVVRQMAKGVERPVIFPLSNPTSKSEADPADLLKWSGGKARVATGSPYSDVRSGERKIRIGQCNNVFIFPGLGLGVLTSGAKRIPDRLFTAAARALSECAPVRAGGEGPLYPPLESVRDVSLRVAAAVAREAERLGLAKPPPAGRSWEELCREAVWEPEYPRLREGMSV